MFDDVNEIIPGLWIGNYHSAHDFDFLRNHNIKVIVNCTVDIPFISDNIKPDKLLLLEPLNTLRIPVEDSLKERDFIKMEYYLQLVLPYLFNHYIKQGKNTLIHCRAGKMRSGCVGLSFLYFLRNYKQDHPSVEGRVPEKMGKSEKQITNWMLRKRPQIFGYGFRNNFRPSFLRFFK
jgi:Dual specificity phosphatase, catalytic domain